MGSLVVETYDSVEESERIRGKGVGFDRIRRITGVRRVSN